jgi:hypothetical protein
LAVSLQSGYSIPTTTNQSNWNTAYGWGNHASEQYLKKEDIYSSYDSTGITYKGVDFALIPDSGLVPKAWVLQMLNMDNNSVQNLVGTSPYWNINNGKNAIINVSANEATITMANLTAGKSGVLTVNCGATGTTVVFSGYTIKIHDSIRHLANTVAVQANTENIFTWYYDGVSVKINGGLNFW